MRPYDFIPRKDYANHASSKLSSTKSISSSQSHLNTNNASNIDINSNNASKYIEKNYYNSTINNNNNNTNNIYNANNNINNANNNNNKSAFLYFGQNRHLTSNNSYGQHYANHHAAGGTSKLSSIVSNSHLNFPKTAASGSNHASSSPNNNHASNSRSPTSHQNTNLIPLGANKSYSALATTYKSNSPSHFISNNNNNINNNINNNNINNNNSNNNTYSLSVNSNTINSSSSPSNTNTNTNTNNNNNTYSNSNNNNANNVTQNSSQLRRRLSVLNSNTIGFEADGAKQENDPSSPKKTQNADDKAEQQNHAKSRHQKIISAIATCSKGGVVPMNPLKTNQDAFFVHENFLNDSMCYFFAVMDGHGHQGHFVSDFVKNRLPPNLTAQMQNNNHASNTTSPTNTNQNNISPTNHASNLLNLPNSRFNNMHQNASPTNNNLTNNNLTNNNLTNNGIVSLQNSNQNSTTSKNSNQSSNSGSFFSPHFMKSVFKKTFKNVCNELANASNINTMFSGTTTVSVLLKGLKMYCANVGDSRAVIGQIDASQNLHAVAISRDHKPDCPDEHKRIMQSGGRVSAFLAPDGTPIGPARVWLQHQDAPGLAMSRSIGDGLAVSAGVIAEPEVIAHDLSSVDKFMVIASDGLWEFIDSLEVCQIVRPFYESRNVSGAVKALVEESTFRWQQEEDVIDDTTVIVVFFNVPE